MHGRDAVGVSSPHGDLVLECLDDDGHSDAPIEIVNLPNAHRKAFTPDPLPSVRGRVEGHLVTLTVRGTVAPK